MPASSACCDRCRRWVPLLFLSALVSIASAQSEPPAAGASAPTAELAHARRLLEGVRDHVYSFDDPAFYAFCRFLKQPGREAAPPPEPLPWSFLLERPSDYRGQLVTLEGQLRSRQPFRVEGERRDVGVLHQCILSEGNTRALSTVVVIDDPGEIPIRSRVRAVGYFLKVRAFETTGGGSGAGPLLVARRLEMLQPPATLGGGIFTRWSGPDWLLAGTGLLAVVWLMLRRATTRGRRPPAAATAEPDLRRAAGDEEFDWLRKLEERE